MHKNSLITLMLWISRLLFGVVFIFSGFVKAIDPLGSTYKFQDYFLAFDMEWMFPLALPLAIIMSGLELLIGIAVLLGIKMRWSAWGGLLFMLFFTPLTLYIALYEPVSDCGCFGDALVISNWATFYKNIFILAAAVLIFYYRNTFRPLWSERKDWILIGIISVLVVSLSVYSLRNLPPIDFRPWKVGNDIESLLQPIQDEIAEYTFVYRNKESGEEAEFTVENLPSGDEWEFVDRKEVIIQEYIAPPIGDFVVLDEYSYDVAEELLGNPDYQFLLVSYDLHRANTRFFDEINAFAQKAEEDGVSFVGLTGNSFEDIEVFRHNLQSGYPFYQADVIKLKTMVRANPGLILMKDWKVLAKWHARNIPDYDQVKQKYMQD